jgi:hypothetical protein
VRGPFRSGFVLSGDLLPVVELEHGIVESLENDTAAWIPKCFEESDYNRAGLSGWNWGLEVSTVPVLRTLDDFHSAAQRICRVSFLPVLFGK